MERITNVTMGIDVVRLSAPAYWREGAPWNGTAELATLTHLFPEEAWDMTCSLISADSCITDVQLFEMIDLTETSSDESADT